MHLPILVDDVLVDPDTAPFCRRIGALDGIATGAGCAALTRRFDARAVIHPIASQD